MLTGRILVILALLSAGLPPAPGPTLAAAGTPPATPTLAASSAASPSFIPPVRPVRVLTPFNPPPHNWLAGHRGVDLAAAADDSVRAAGAGVVAFAGVVVDRPVVSIDHVLASGQVLRTTYEPVHPVVAAGAPVRAGQLIGTLQAGHPSCRPASCLHWGARFGRDGYVNPLALLTGYRVRLLPWTDKAPG